MNPSSAALAVAALLAAGSGPSITAITTTTIPREPGFFDYMAIDAPEHRLLVAHTGSNSVAFVNTDTGAFERQLYIGAAHGVAIDERDGVYFVGTSGAEKGVVVINRSTLAIEGKIATPGPVDALIIDTRRDRLYADQDDGESIWVYGASDRRPLATIQTPGDSDKGAYDPISERIYQNFTTVDQVIAIDPRTFAKVDRWSTLPATKPHGLAVDGQRRRLYAAGTNGKLADIDMTTGRVIASLAIAAHVDQIALDRKRRRLYCASGDGLLSVVDVRGATPRLIESLPVPDGAHTLAVDEADGSVWISYGTQTSDYVRKLALPR